MWLISSFIRWSKCSHHAVSSTCSRQELTWWNLGKNISLCLHVALCISFLFAIRWNIFLSIRIFHKQVNTPIIHHCRHRILGWRSGGWKPAKCGNRVLIWLWLYNNREECSVSGFCSRILRCFSLAASVIKFEKNKKNTPLAPYLSIFLSVLIYTFLFLGSLFCLLCPHIEMHIQIKIDKS